MKLQIEGDVSGIRTSSLNELAEIATATKTARHELINNLLLISVARFSSAWKKEIAIFISRNGVVSSIFVGSFDRVNLPSLKNRQRGRMRCIHTHPNGNPQLSRADIAAVETLNLESLASVGIHHGNISGLQIIANPYTVNPEIVNLSPSEFSQFDYGKYIHAHEDKGAEQPDPKLSDTESALLCGLEDSNNTVSLTELDELAKTAGVNVVGKVLQPKKSGNNATYVGRGKIEEIKLLLQTLKANLVICDDELTPSQQRNLEEQLKVKVIDRSSLILDIFAQRARSREGILQVELAQLKYLLPRLTGQGGSLSRLGGGVGTRGPGETKLETDRRRIRTKITQLEKELSQVLKERATQRKQRLRNGLPVIALVGYTNAGKTTFLQKALEQGRTNYAKIPLGENKLFATLDPIIRSVRIDSQHEVLLSDTVGFIQKLPHHLLKAFLATLEEVHQADLLIHVVDSGDPHALEHIDTVTAVLKQLNCENKPIITVLNKIDKVHTANDIERLKHTLPNPIALSLLRGDSLTPVWSLVRHLLKSKEDFLVD